MREDTYVDLCLMSNPPVYSLLSRIECASARHGNVPGPNAASSASRTVLAKTNCIRARTSFGTSCSASFLFAHGSITMLAPARCAPSTFSLIPPTGETRPRSVIWEYQPAVRIARRVSAGGGGVLFAHLASHGSRRRDTLSRQEGYDRTNLSQPPSV